MTTADAVVRNRLADLCWPLVSGALSCHISSMTVGVGNGVAYVATGEQPRAETWWHARFLAAFGGAVVVVIGLMLTSGWTTGLRPSTFDQLRSDLKDGSVQQWYVAERFDDAPLDLKRASASGIRGDLDDLGPDQFNPAKGDPLGGILVWRTWGLPGWQVASQSGVASAGSSYSAAATEESDALVGDLRAAGVAMKPYEFADSGPFDWVYPIGAVLLLGGLIMGTAPRVGTRWFWFWIIIGVPLALGAVVYAVMELIGMRRRPDPPLDKRVSGLKGFVGSLIAGLVVSFAADWLRGRGFSIPF